MSSLSFCSTSDHCLELFSCFLFLHSLTALLTHTHTHTHTHTRTHSHTHTRTHTHTHTHTHPHPHTPTLTRTHIHTHSHAHAHTHTHSHAHPHPHTPTLTHTHTHTHPHSHARTYTLAAAAENIRQMFNQQQLGGMVSEEELRRSLVGLCRDLRGVALAFHSRNTYMLLFDWMYPPFVSLFRSLYSVLFILLFCFVSLSPLSSFAHLLQLSSIPISLLHSPLFSCLVFLSLFSIPLSSVV